MPERSVLVPPLHTRLHVYLHTFILPAPAGSRPAAHARFGPGRRLGHLRCAASGPSSYPSITAQRSRPPALLSLIGPRGRPPTVSLHEVSTAQVVLPPARLPIRHSSGRAVGSPQCHCTRCRLCRCAASCPSFYPSLTAPRGRPPTVSRHEVSTVQVCCLRPVLRSNAHRAAGLGRLECHCTRCRPYRLCCLLLVFPSVSHRAAGSGNPQCHGTRWRLCRCAASGPSSVLSLTAPRGWAAHKFLRLLVLSIWPASPGSPWSPFRPGRCRHHADSDTNIPSGRSVSCAIDDSSNPSLAFSIFSPAPATPAHPCPALCQVPPVPQALLPFSFFLSCGLRAGLGSTGPAAGRLPNCAPARSAGGRT